MFGLADELKELSNVRDHKMITTTCEENTLIQNVTLISNVNTNHVCKITNVSYLSPLEFFTKGLCFQNNYVGSIITIIIIIK